MANYCHYLTGQRFAALVVLAFARGAKLLSGEITTCPACGYRHDAERHSQARMQLPLQRRAEITPAARAARK